MLSIKNCDFVEIPVPQGVFDVAVKDTIRVSEDGMVYASQKPGLGYEPDWDAVEELTIEVI
jgi:L-alanine-DL-glutamate epimerase-like enolase superfamily enzyme